jgi:hypothetical protein
MVTANSSDAGGRVSPGKHDNAHEAEPATTETRVRETESALEYIPTSDTVKPDIDSSDVVY